MERIATVFKRMQQHEPLTFQNYFY